MKKIVYSAMGLGFVLLVAAGCAGLTETAVVRTASVTGRVLDINSNPVRDAKVSCDGQIFYTTNTGAYQFTEIKTGQTEVVAETNQDGTNYRGRTWVNNFDGEQRSSGNIIVAPTNQLGDVAGTVRDRDGFVLQDVQVYAYSGAGSAQRAFSDENGNYRLRDLIGGVTYEVRAMARGYRSDWDAVSVVALNTTNLNLNLGNPGSPSLTPPQNLDVVTWVSKIIPAAPGMGDHVEWMKSHMAGTKTGKPTPITSTTTKALRGDIVVESELIWDEQRFDELLGWGIYRGNGASGALAGLQFYADPLSAYFFDAGLNPSSSYNYAVTTLEADYPDFPSSTESAFSNRVSVSTLSELVATSATFSPLTFHWQSGSGATSYVVYVFDRFPAVGVDSIWNNEGAPTASTNLAYSGPVLEAGRTHYYMVLGLANGNKSRTISGLVSFVP